MRILAIGSDRSDYGTLVPGTPASARQEVYAQALGHIDDIGFTRRQDGFRAFSTLGRSVYLTRSRHPLLYGFDAFRIALSLPRPDVVVTQDPFEAGLVGWFIARVRRAPLYVQVHTDFLSPAYASLSMAYRIRVLIARFVLRRADRIRVVSRRIRESIIGIIVPKATITVLPVYIDVACFEKARAGAIAGRFSRYTKKFLVVARLEREKNVGCALEAFAKTAPERACLIIVGDGNQRHSLERYAARLGVADHVFFEGQQDPVPYYTCADLVLVPSKFEGYGRVVVEALAAGKPVLSTDVGIAREAGAIITSAENFADALSGWIEDGPRIGELRGYPYASFDEYIKTYTDDIAACL